MTVINPELKAGIEQSLLFFENQAEPLSITSSTLEKIEELLSKISVFNKQEVISDDWFFCVSRLIKKIDRLQYDRADRIALAKIFCKHPCVFSKSFAAEFSHHFRLRHRKESISSLGIKELERILRNKLKEDMMPLISSYPANHILNVPLDNFILEPEVVLIQHFYDSDHLMHFFVKKLPTHYEIFCMETLGFSADEDVDGNHYIKEVINYFSKQQCRIELYFLSYARQSDKTNCGVFVCKDIQCFVECKKGGIDLFEKAKKSAVPSAKYSTGNLKIFHFTDIPPSMMKLCQKETVLQEYLATYPDYGSHIVNAKRNESLNSNIQRHSFIFSYSSGEIAKMNVLAQIKFAQYTTVR